MKAVPAENAYSGEAARLDSSSEGSALLGSPQGPERLRLEVTLVRQGPARLTSWFRIPQACLGASPRGSLLRVPRPVGRASECVG